MSGVTFIRRELADIIQPEALMNKASAPAAPRAPTYNPQQGEPPSLEQKRPRDLEVDHSYQRLTDTSASQRLIAHIAKNWHWALCVPLVVSRRPSGLFVIDGQHRLEGARRRGDIDFLPCIINTYGSAAEEAAMFVAANRARRPITRLDDYRAAIAAGDAVALEVDEMIEQSGLKVARNNVLNSWKPGEIAFTSAIAAALKKYGRKLVSAALVNIAEAFKGQILPNGAAMFGALLLILHEPPPEFDPDVLFDALGMFPASKWNDFTQAQMGGVQRVAAMREAVLMAYAEKAGGPAMPAEGPFSRAANVPGQ